MIQSSLKLIKTILILPSMVLLPDDKNIRQEC